MAEATFGRYTIRGTLGQGGFATVYSAWDPWLQREVALKALRPDLARDPDVYRRFINEAQALARLQHANIVQVYDVGEEEGRPFFAMELVRGYTIAQALQHSRPDTAQAIDTIRKLASALDALHRSGLVHRDVKPANIMLDNGGRVVLMDLGIARSLTQTQYTQTGTSLGTPAYMSPEQVRGQPATPAADIYALGILAYHLFAGRPPFEGDTAFVLHAQAFDPPAPLEQIRPDLPRYVCSSVAAALAKDPAMRPTSAGAFAAALAGDSGAYIQPPGLVSAQSGIGTVSLDRTVVTPPQPAVLSAASRKPWGLVLAAVAVVLAGLGLGGAVVLAVHSRGGGGNNGALTAGSQAQQGTIVITPSVSPKNAESGATTAARIAATAALPSATAAPPTVPATARATAPPAPTPRSDVQFSNLQLRSADQWGVGTGPLQGCFDFASAPDGALARVRLTRQQDPGSPLEDVAEPLSASSGNLCVDVPPQGRASAGNYVAFLFDGDWRPGPSAAFNVAAPPAPATRPPAPPPVAAPAGPDLSAPPSSAAGRPAPKIIAVTPSGPARPGASFQFSVTIRNFGASGGAGSISVSSPNQRDVQGAGGSCDVAATPQAYPAGSRISFFNNGAASGTVTSSNPLVELGLAAGLPQNGTCTFNVTSSALSGSTATFYMRVTLAAGGGAISSWPLQSGISDQQGLPVIRWDVPIGP